MDKPPKVLCICMIYNPKIFIEKSPYHARGTHHHPLPPSPLGRFAHLGLVAPLLPGTGSLALFYCQKSEIIPPPFGRTCLRHCLLYTPGVNLHIKLLLLFPVYILYNLFVYNLCVLFSYITCN